MGTINLSRQELIIFLVSYLVPMMLIGQNVEQKSSPADLVDALHTTFGNNHSRAVHAKGIILEGTFTPAKGAAALTKAPHLQKQSSNVILRFSDFTGIPTIPDNNPAANPRGLAIKFTLPNGTSTDIVGHSFNGFPTSDSDQFRELLLAIASSGKETQKPNTLEKFLATHPIAKTFLTTQKVPASFATINYFGVNSFKFTNAKGVSHYVRYQFIADEGEVLVNEAQQANLGPNYLMDEIAEHISKRHIKFKLFAEIAVEGDEIGNPSIAWPSSREKVLLGTIEISKLAVNTETQDKALSFSPNNIPAGIETADPMLDFRAKAYPISVKERQ